MKVFDWEPLPINKWRNHVSHLPNEPELIEQLLVPNEIMILAGKFGIGKTLELINLMYCFAYDDAKWHGLKVEPVDSLYLTWEGNPKKLSERLGIIEKQYVNYNKKCECYFKLIKGKMPLNTESGREALKRLIGKLEHKPRVIMLDPFKRVVLGNYSRPEVAEEWIEGAQTVAQDIEAAIITANHTNKITYKHNESPDALGADKVKGAYDLLDGSHSAVIIAEEVGNKRIPMPDGSTKVKYIKFGTVIKVLKAKDATAEFPLLNVDLDRKELRLTGEHWVVDSKGNIGVEWETPTVQKVEK